nr:beta-galactosidase 16-like [Ipomoea batatas]
MNNISLLSATVGLPDSGPYLEHSSLGPHKVTIEGSEGSQDLSNNSWGYQVGLLGEKLQIYTTKGSNVVQWKEFSSAQPLVWYKTFFDEPEGNDPLALNLGSMGKGEVWVNGQSIGRYWVSFRTLAGIPSQTWYNVPRSFLKPTGNLLILFEEEYGNPCNITLDTVSITSVCGHVTDSNPPFKIPWKRYARRPKVQLNCPPNRNISKILFASFGRPFGDCSAYAVGSCHSSNSRAIVEKVSYFFSSFLH